MIRAILCLSEITLFLTLGCPWLLYYWLLKKKEPKKAAEGAQRFGVGWILGVITKTALGGKELRVEGLENVPKEGGVLFVSNHRSFFDIITSYSVVPRQVGFIAKDGLWKVPSLRRWMQIVNCQFLNRKDIRQGMEVIKKCIELEKDGNCIWVCPEGTRNRNPDPVSLLEFHEGSFKIAERSGCKIVPVAFYGTDRLWEQHFPTVKPVPVTIKFGKPYTVADLGPEWKKKTGAYTRMVIQEMLVEEQHRRGEKPFDKPAEKPAEKPEEKTEKKTEEKTEA